MIHIEIENLLIHKFFCNELEENLGELVSTIFH